ncbi:hypothetical protein [Endozoicomonas sp.]|uniref:hypothetical protein n=1 Tax=Endozoicomonas sp. TaxID=1892382 RepID=UPI003AF749C8
MKKYILLFFFTLIHLLPKHAFSSYELIGYELGSSPKPFTEEEKLLNKIEAIQEKLDELVSENELSQSLALTASGVLATFAFGIFRMISFAQSDTKEPIYNWELDDEWKTMRTFIFNDTILAALGIGGAIGYSNYTDEKLPSLSAKDSLKVGIETFITGFGLSLLLSGTSYMFHETDNKGFFYAVRAAFHGLTNLLTAIRMCHYINQARQDRQDEIFDLKIQLKKARNKLAQLRGDIAPDDI